MRVGMMGDHLGPSRRSDRFAFVVVFEVVGHFGQQLVGVAVGRQVLAVAEQLGQAIAGEVVGDQQ